MAQKILLADEDSPIYRGLQNTLVHEGYEVHIVHNYADIHIRLGQHQYACLIMELLLPKTSTKASISHEEMQEEFLKVAAIENRPPIILNQCVFDPNDPWFKDKGATFIFGRPTTNASILAALAKLRIYGKNRLAEYTSEFGCVQQMSESHPGAMQVISSLMTWTPIVDTTYRVKGIGLLHRLDEMRIYGPDIHTLWASCDRDITKLIAVLRAEQLGLADVTADKIQQAAIQPDSSIFDFDAIMTALKQKMPGFNSRPPINIK